MEQRKLNESFTLLTGTEAEIRAVHEHLRVEKPDVLFNKRIIHGLESRFRYYSKVMKSGLLVMNGHLCVLGKFGVSPYPIEPEFTEDEIASFISDITPKLPFTPHDFQIAAFRDSVLVKNQINKMATGSGKSLTISLFAEFMRQKRKRGLLLVPNVNLLTQFKSDIADYGLSELYAKTQTIGGGETNREFWGDLVISTWQSLQDTKKTLDTFDYLIVDEAHRFASDETSEIVGASKNAKYKLAFTGTLPSDKAKMMCLLGLFHAPRTYITARELIDRGLATPININAFILRHSEETRKLFIQTKDYQKKLKIIKECTKRQEFVVALASKVRKLGNTLVLFQHTEHGKEIFLDLMRTIHPEVIVQNKDITGRKSFEFQEKHGVFFLNGEDDAKTREATRKILEEHENAVLVANYALLSTGVNIKKLHNMVLASPLKSYESITQSIGRGMRLHPSKKVFNVFDIVDSFGVRAHTGIFWKQYQERCANSYHREEIPVKETLFDV